MKNILLVLLLMGTAALSMPQDPVLPKKDHIYVEFITDCNWLIYGLEGKFKLHPQHDNAVGLRAWTPYLTPRDIEIKGIVIWRNVDWVEDIRDIIIFPWSSLKIEYPYSAGTSPFKWSFVVHFNELSGKGIPNAETHMRVWGPCQTVRLYHGEAMIKHGDETFYIKVDENDPLNYPPWEIKLN